MRKKTCALVYRDNIDNTSLRHMHAGALKHIVVCFGLYVCVSWSVSVCVYDV